MGKKYKKNKTETIRSQVNPIPRDASPMQKQAEKALPNLFPKNDDLQQKKLKNVYLTSLIISCIAMVISSFWFGLSGDEAYANGMGKAAWKYISTFGADQSIFHLPDNINRDGVLTYYGNIFDIICIWLNNISPFGEYETRHLFNAFVGFIGIYYASRLIQRYWGYLPAIICIWIMFFFPFYFGHSMNNPKDIPMASFYIMGIFYLLRFFDRFDHLTWKDYLLVILPIMMDIDVRVAGILIITYIPLVALIHLPQLRLIAAQKGWFRVILPMVIIGLAPYLLSAIFWPYAAQDPINNPLKALDFLSDFKIALGQIWEGEYMSSQDFPKNYLTHAIFITLPWVIIIGFVIGIILIFSKNKQLPYFSTYLFVLFTCLFPVFYIIYKGSNVYHLWRHVLFIAPSLCIIASLGYYFMMRYMPSTKFANYVLIGFALLLIEPIIFTIRTFPNNVNYFNSTVGGLKGAYGNYEVDFYYNGLKPCVDEFEKIIQKANPKDTIVLASNAYHLMGEYFKDKYPNLKLEYVRYMEKNMKSWDYAIFHIALVPLQEIQNEQFTTYNGPIYVNNILDKPICALYKRPSYLDLKMSVAIDSQDVLSAQQYSAEYLKSDPNNLMVRDIFNQTSAIIQQAQQNQNQQSSASPVR